MTKVRAMLFPAVALLAMGASAHAQEANLPSLVTVSGSADSKATPDTATIQIGVETQGKTAGEAQRSTSELANRLIAAALKVVPDKKSFQTSDLSLSPVYPQPGFGGASAQLPRIVGYRARNILTIRVDDVAKVGPLVDAVTAAGATNVDSISFGIKDDKAAKKQALRNAVIEAREKAEALAAGLGYRLGDVYSIEEGGGVVVRPYLMRMSAMADGATPVMPGEVSISANVSVRFRLIK